jgi:hypothetical protein
MTRATHVLLALISISLCSCTNLYSTKVTHDLPNQVKGTVWVHRIFPREDPGAQPEKELFYQSLATIGLTRAGSMNDADWCLFYSSVLEGSRITGYTAHMITDTMASISADRNFSRVLEAKLMDRPGKPPRWEAQVIAITSHLSDRDTMRMIGDALTPFPGPTYQKRDKWR